MLKARSRRLIMALAAGTLTMSGAAGALAAEESPGGGQRAGDVQTADDGGGLNPMCMLRPQDCMYPPDDDRNGDGKRQPSRDGGGMNPLCMFRPQDCWPPPGHDGKGDGDTRPSPGGGRTGG